LTDVVMQTPFGVFPRDLPVFAGGWQPREPRVALC